VYIIIEYIITNPQLSKENFREKEKLVTGPGWWPDTRTDWPIDHPFESWIKMACPK
jgi:hypothetical protein